MKSLLIILLTWCSLNAVAQSTLTVTNLNDSGPGSLRQQVFNSTNGDFIRFDNSLISNGSDTLFLNFPIIVDNGVHINGLISGTDTLFISGHDSTQIFYMDFTNAPGHEVHLDSLVIIDAKQYAQDGSVANQNGGAILALGLDSLKITNSVFRNCRVAGNGNGGAVFSRYTNLVIERTSFIGNHTDTILPSSGQRGIGGAIRCGVGHLFCANTIFKGNYSGDRGGAIYLGVVDFEFYSCIFIGNKTSANDPAWRVLEGGAVYTLSCQFANFIKCRFSGNTAASSGGAIRMTTGLGSNYQLNVSQCIFEANKSGKNGGALALNDQYLNLSNTNFLRNQSSLASSSGGGGSIYLSYGSYSIANCSFLQNSSNVDGGAILSSFNYGQIENCTFLNNSSIQGSAVIDIELNQIDSLHLSSSIFSAPPSSSTFDNNPDILSHGQNIFSDSPSFAVSTDQTSVDSATLALEPLASNGGFTQTLLPGPTSVALNMGNPVDFSDAQNGPIYGRRDVGAAERPVIIYDTTLACSPTTWWGNTYNTAGTYSDTAFNANSIDSVGVLVMYHQDTSVFDLDGTLYASEEDTNTLYQWVDCDNNWAPILGATSRNFLPPSNGNYAVILTNQNCVDTSSCFSYNRFNIYEAATGAKWITCYPNPTTGNLYIDFTNQAPTQLELLDIWGRIVLTQPVQSGVTSIQLPEISDGTYFIRWTSSSGNSQIDRIVIQD